MKYGFLKSQVTDQIKGSIFFSQIRKARLAEIEKKRSEYEWGAPLYKIYPSGLKFTMCPVEFVRGLEKFSGIEDIGSQYKVKRGSAVHAELQEDMLTMPGLFAKERLHLPDDEQRAKLDLMWPEVPFWDKASGISGRLDGLLDYNGPVPLEIKSTSVDPKKWEEHIEKNLPNSQHICQGAVYCYELSHLGYVDRPITRFVLAYINLLYMPGTQLAEKEFVIEYNQELAERTKLLIDHLTLARQAYIIGEQINCDYPGCWTHGRRKAE